MNWAKKYLLLGLLTNILPLFGSPCDISLVQPSYLEIDTGYRWDRLNNRVTLYGFAVGARSATQIAKRINSYQLGAKGLWNFYDGAYIRASGHYGWIGSGDYDEASFVGPLSGNTWDASGGIGWLIPLNLSWGFAPVIGWSYDELDLVANDVLSGIGPQIGRLNFVGDINCKSTFQGPWFGIDTYFQPTPCFDLVLGYELHRAKWRGKRILENGELGAIFGTTTGFSNTREQCPIWGNLFRINGTYHFSCFQIGLELKYQTWQQQNTGRYKRTTVPLAPAFNHQLITNVEWDSFSASLQFGYFF